MSTTTQIFTDSKTLDSPVLNHMGVQPFRAVVARTLYNLHATPREPVATELARTGFATIPDFLPPDAFEATVRETAEYVDETLPRWIHQHGTTTVYNYPLQPTIEARFPHLAAWRVDDRAFEMASVAERRPLRVGTGAPLIEHVALGDYSDPDPQTVLHIDAFFTTHKLWLYLDDVTPENGAFVYVPGSHRFDLARLRQEYRQSTNRDCVEPSRRIRDDEVRRRGLERRVVTCPRNTLVIVNTSGYHCRSVGQAGASRRALHMSFRFNPFWYPMPRVSRAVRGAARRLRGR